MRETGRSFLAASAGDLTPTISEAYVLPILPGSTSPSRQSTPSTSGPAVAIRSLATPTTIHCSSPSMEDDLVEWERYFDQFDVSVDRERQPADEVDGAIQFVLQPRDNVKAELVDGRPVIPLDETVEFANEHYATFQSALDMLDRMYEDVDTDADYRMEPA
ncbi:MAG: RNA polymerase subunit sigma-70 [Natrialbaceae archaeon]|nr:RNA polymerase subunit sigma-70 [Natrialbaceae archaeon]